MLTVPRVSAFFTAIREWLRASLSGHPSGAHFTFFCFQKNHIHSLHLPLNVNKMLWTFKRIPSHFPRIYFIVSTALEFFKMLIKVKRARSAGNPTRVCTFTWINHQVNLLLLLLRWMNGSGYWIARLPKSAHRYANWISSGDRLYDFLTQIQFFWKS